MKFLLLLVTVGLVACRDEAPPSHSAGSPLEPLPTATVAQASVAASTAEPLAPPAPFVPEKVTGEDHAMGTHLAYASFTTPALDATRLHALFDAATAEVRRLEKLMTTWAPRRRSAE